MHLHASFTSLVFTVMGWVINQAIFGLGFTLMKMKDFGLGLEPMNYIRMKRAYRTYSQPDAYIIICLQQSKDIRLFDLIYFFFFVDLLAIAVIEPIFACSSRRWDLCIGNTISKIKWLKKGFSIIFLLNLTTSINPFILILFVKLHHPYASRRDYWKSDLVGHRLWPTQKEREATKIDLQTNSNY